MEEVCLFTVNKTHIYFVLGLINIQTQYSTVQYGTVQ